jgi:sugar lactone lactonase YvrE
MTADGSNLYWAAKIDGTIMKAPSGGGKPITLASNQEYPSTGIAVSGSRVYWFNYFSQRQVMSVDIAGGEPVQLAAGGWDLRDLAVDETGIYFPDSGLEKTIMRMDREGGALTTVATDSGATMLTAIAIDAESVYWTRLPAKLMKVSKSGGTPVELGTGDGARDVAVHGSHVFWLTGSALLKTGVDGGESVVLVDGQEYANSLAVDAENAYWVDFTAGNVMKVSVDGGPPTTIASGQDSPQTVAVDDVYVYWSNGGDSTIRKAPK